MSNHDRGAYTPHQDAPLSFDARYSRGRPAFPTTLVISLMILAGLAAAIVMFYRSGVRSAGQPPAAVGAPVGDIKSPPPPGAQQPADAGQGLQIYQSENGAAPASSPPQAAFAPPPEQPQPRPAPTTPVTAQPMAPAASSPPPVAVAPAPAVVSAKPAPQPEAPKAVAMTPAKPAPKAQAAAKAQSSDEIGKLLKEDASKPKAAPKSEAAPKAATGGPHAGPLVQFGAFSSTDIASAEWAKLAKAHGSDMSGKGKVVEAVERNGKTLYRTAVSGFSSRADAAAFCAKLKADGHDCLVK